MTGRIPVSRPNHSLLDALRSTPVYQEGDEVKKHPSLNVAYERQLMYFDDSFIPFCSGKKVRDRYWCY
jgi:hypothetical protein